VVFEVEKTVEVPNACLLVGRKYRSNERDQVDLHESCHKWTAELESTLTVIQMKYSNHLISVVLFSKAT
jgi:hypothetical protein